MNVLIVEDEVSLAKAIKKILESAGYVADAVHDGADGVKYAKDGDYSLVILDVMLPKLDGFEVIRMLREAGVSTPVLMLTARSAVRDKVRGLNGGADDYMTKPFDAEELVARVGALTRRRGEVIVDRAEYGDISLDVNSAELYCGGESVRLSHKEFEVLRTFIFNPNMTVTKDLLISTVWGMDSEATDNNVEVYISFIRKKLKYLGSKVTIKNIQRIGYRLDIEKD